MGLELEIRPADIDETPDPGETAVAHVARLAAAKADAVARQTPERWVLAADTTVEIDGAILGKARDHQEARDMLGRLVGRTHRVSTAFAVRGPGDVRIVRTVTTEVTMRPVAESEVDGYLAATEWEGKAGAYAVQGMAAAWVTDVRGSITNVIGLPLAEVVQALAELGGPAPDYPRGVPA